MVFVPGVANELTPLFAPPRPANPPAPKPLPNPEVWPNVELPPPNAEVPELPPRAPKPPVVVVEVAVLEAKLVSFVPAAAPNGDLALEPLTLPNGEAVDEAKPPKPEALNLSSLVRGSSSGAFVVVEDGFWGDKEAKGDVAAAFAKLLPDGIWRTCQ